jgi:hypothetical protein
VSGRSILRARFLKQRDSDPLVMFDGAQDDLIGVAFDDHWLKFKNLAAEEYRNAIFRLES